jgi:CubicO group peptidase (beta-lactamase class C family)
VFARSSLRGHRDLRVAFARPAPLGVATVVAIALGACLAPRPEGVSAQRFETTLPKELVRRVGRDEIAARVPLIEATFEEASRADQWPGLAIGIVSRDGLVRSRGFGVADLDSKVPVTEHTVFRIGSITKTLTGLALLELRDEGKLGLDDPVDKTLPEFARLVYPSRDSPKVTLRHLVTHSSGLSRDGALPKLREGGHVPVPAELLATLDGQRLEYAPGAGYEYSNQGAAFVGAVVERVSGTPFEAYVLRTLLGPLGMSESGFSPRAEWGARLATGYVRTGNAWKKEELTPKGATAATGHLYTTASDLARYVAFEIDAWPPRDDPERGPIRRSTVRESQLVAGMQPAKSSADAVFWVTESQADVGLVVSHSGTIDGFHAAVRFAPEAGVGVLALTNVRSPEGFEAAVHRALDLLLGTVARGDGHSEGDAAAE